MTVTMQVKSEIDAATSIGELLDIFDHYLIKDHATTSKGKKRKEANDIALAILDRIDGDFSRVTDEDREKLREYTGWGGIGGSTNEYYTPKWIASATWQALAAYGLTAGNVLEPASGVGVFSETKPKGTVISSVEMDKTSAAINQILHPEDAVINSAFEEVATNANYSGYDAVIGNPPYGSRDESMFNDKEYKDIKLADQYFVTRSIDKTKGGGLIALIVPTRIVEGSDLKKWRSAISLKAEFLGAHRLPSDVFGDAGTSVVTDLVIWRKHSDEAKDVIDAASAELLKESNVLWDTFINGKWFEKEGKAFINGTQSVRGKGKFARKIVDRGNKSNEQVAKSLSVKFDSRIDWSDLSTVEPIITVYNEGDQRMMNGHMMRYEADKWVNVNNHTESTKVDAAKFGGSSVDTIAALSSNSASMLKLSYAQAKAIYDEFRYVTSDEFGIIMKALESIPQKNRERVMRGILLGKEIKKLSNSLDLNIVEQAQELRKKLSNLLIDEYHKNGAPKQIAVINELPAEMQSDYQYYKQSTTKDGKLSDLITGELRRESVNQYNTDEAGDVLHMMFREHGSNSLSLDDFKLAYTGRLKDLPDAELLDALASDESVAINLDGSISGIHRATSGHIVAKIDQLHNAIAYSPSPAVTENFKRQLALIDKKRHKIAVSDIQMKLTDKWIPKHTMLEFLLERGYSKFKLGKYIEGEDGVEFFDSTYRGPDAVFVGYRVNENGKASSKPEEAFERQIESYLNAGAVRGGKDNAGKAAVRKQIANLDSQFTQWANAGDYSELLENEYNNTFNNYIEPDYDDSELHLTGVSGAIKFMGYQNAAIRRHSADGCGIIGFGTGLGKTLTGLGLIKYNQETGRAKRTAVVVPKSVLENWFHESDLFFGEANLSSMAFIGIELQFNKDGSLMREPVLDDEGNQKLDQNDQPIMRAKIKVDTSGKKIGPQLHELAQSSKAKIVVMTMDAYKAIPMKPETIADNVDQMVGAGLMANSGKFVTEAKKYREKQKNDKFKAKHADDGTAKNESLPYFEDLLFDSVLVDEGHNYRNSYKTGTYGNRLAFMPNGSQADQALDMQMKNNLIKRRNNGKGVYMLTATPTVNSPIDAFNMLSHIVPPETFARMGIVDSDDFIRLFGRTEETNVHKLSGDVETKEALVGFQNLDALRNLFHRFVTIKDIKDVNAEVHIPDLETQTNYVEMSEEQREIYEELRERAEALSSLGDTPEDAERLAQIQEEFPDDSVFGLIRKMDKANTDLDLYHGVITYRFAKSNQQSVEEMIATLPTSIKMKVSTYDEKSGKKKLQNKEVPLSYKTKTEGKHFVLVASQEIDHEIASKCEKLKLKFSHPVPPKYAKFLENAKASYLSGGKQLVFTEEKSQHVKLARIISQFIGCKMSEIGIINSDSVAGKKGAAVDSLDDSGLEAIAKEYNTGKYKFCILNKKGEVGINLHHGTTDIHHLTLPFTPASLTQRNGRGARVGSKQAKVNVHYYAGKGSFDKFRISTIERKARWINELFNGNEKSVDNANADDADETAILLASDPEEARRRIAAANLERERKLKAEFERVATINVSKYLAAISADSIDEDKEKEIISNASIKANEARELLKNGDLTDWAKKHQQETLSESNVAIAQANRRLERKNNARNTIAQTKPMIEQSIKDGILQGCENLFDAPELYHTKMGKVVRIGLTYNVNYAPSWQEPERREMAVITVTNVHSDGSRASGRLAVENKKLGNYQLGQSINFNIEDVIGIADIDQSKAELEARAREGINTTEVKSMMDRDTFFDLIKRKVLTRFGNVRQPLRFDPNVGKFEAGHNIPDSEYEASNVVYPDLDDKPMRKKILNAVFDYVNLRGEIPRWSYELEHYLGSSWQDELADMGEKATDEQIALFVKERIEKEEQAYSEDLAKALKGCERSIRYVSDHITSNIRNAKMKGFSNPSEIHSKKWDMSKDYKESLIERSKANINEGREMAFAAYVDLCANDPSRNERLKSIAELMVRYSAEHHFSKNLVDLYSKNENEAALQMWADLTVMDRVPQLQNGDELFKLNPMSTVGYKFSNVFRQYKMVFIQDVEKLSPTEPEVVDVPLTESQASKIENLENIDLDFAEVKAKLSQVGITMKLNTETIVKSWKRKKTTLEANAYIGLFDEKGVTGALKSRLAGKANKSTQEEFGAVYSADISESFTGSWWFIRSDSDLSKLVAVLTN